MKDRFPTLSRRRFVGLCTAGLISCTLQPVTVEAAKMETLKQDIDRTFIYLGSLGISNQDMHQCITNSLVIPNIRDQKLQRIAFEKQIPDSLARNTSTLVDRANKTIARGALATTWNVWRDKDASGGTTSVIIFNESVISASATPIYRSLSEERAGKALNARSTTAQVAASVAVHEFYHREGYAVLANSGIYDMDFGGIQVANTDLVNASKDIAKAYIDIKHANVISNGANLKVVNTRTKESLTLINLNEQFAEMFSALVGEFSRKGYVPGYSDITATDLINLKYLYSGIQKDVVEKADLSSLLTAQKNLNTIEILFANILQKMPSRSSLTEKYKIIMNAFEFTNNGEINWKHFSSLTRIQGVI
jgi:hypothetical protein